VNRSALKVLPRIFAAARATRRSMSGGPGYHGPTSDHFDGRRFFNLTGTSAGRSLADVLRWQFTAKRKPWPAWVENTVAPALPGELEAGELAISFINHITFLLQYRGLNLLTDPVFSLRASPVQWLGPKRRHHPGVPFDALPPIHAVLLSHNHYDHLDLQALRRLSLEHRSLIITPLGNSAFLKAQGIEPAVDLDWWQDFQYRQATITLTPAQHWSSRGPGNRNRNLWGGFSVSCEGQCLYFAGDTGYGSHFRDIGRRVGTIDVALLPIGAYEPRWFMAEQHMNPAEAVQAHLDLASRFSIATHFGCFRLTDEGIDEPVHDLTKALNRFQVSPDRFVVPVPGQTILRR
jgi:L-ascorbate metabolism protein UlaG (beta-lactamase superfamily)